MRRVFAAAAVQSALAIAPALAGETPAPAGAVVYFIAPQDGATVTSPVTVVFGLKDMGVAPAGVEQEKTGHHHLLIDADMPSGDALNEPIPADGITSTSAAARPRPRWNWRRAPTLCSWCWATGATSPTTRRSCHRRSPLR
jgi:hypothetical protein